MNNISVVLAAVVIFLILFGVWGWMVMRVNALKSALEHGIADLQRAVGLVDGIDGQITKALKRSLDNEVEIEGIGRAHRKLSASINAQTNRDKEAELDLTMTQIADYIQEPTKTAEEIAPHSANAQSEVDPAYR